MDFAALALWSCVASTRPLSRSAARGRTRGRCFHAAKVRSVSIPRVVDELNAAERRRQDARSEALAGQREERVAELRRCTSSGSVSRRLVQERWTPEHRLDDVRALLQELRRRHHQRERELVRRPQVLLLGDERPRRSR